MRVLILFVTHAPGGALETRERSFEGEALTLGRATDQVLQFKDRRVAFQHARIYRRGERSVLACRPPATIAVNDALVRDAELNVGDVLRIGANLLTIVAPPPGVDLALTFELDPQASAADLEVPSASLRLALPGLGKRGWSWLLFAAVLLAFLAVPLLTLPLKPAREALRASVLPSDRAWATGPLHAAHRTLAGRCESCHGKAFTRVGNAACLACHGPQLRRHVAVAGPPVPALATARCADCHGGHAPNLLTRRDEALCTVCHARLAAVTSGHVEALAATEFGTAHPEFRVSIRRVDGAGRMDRERLRLDGAAVREHSGLKFGHARHLDPKGLDSPDGRKVLVCADCHQPEPGGARMQPIVMQQHCQGCHRLDFDPAFPERQLPHGDAAAALNTLYEYESARYLEGWPDPRAGAHPDRFAATPGPALAPAERERRLGQARARTAIVARDLFERRACVVCHDVRATPGAATPWAVAPVHLTHEWFPEARFDHSRHGTTLTDCAGCHAASHSSKSEDVLMPRIEVCRTCHAGANAAATAKVASGCPLCHAFHDSRRELWTVQGATSGRAR